MARGINKVTLIGNLGQDPELRYTGSGTPVCTLRVATTDTYKDRDGQVVEKTEWHSVVFWSRQAEICGEYLRKGSRIYVEGSLQTRSWDDRDGNTRYKTEVKGLSMLMLDGRRESSPRPGGSERYPTGQSSRSGPDTPPGREGIQAPDPQDEGGASREDVPAGNRSFEAAGDQSGAPLDDLPF